MFVLVAAVTHSPARDTTSTPCDIWLKFLGWAKKQSAKTSNNRLSIFLNRT